MRLTRPLLLLALAALLAPRIEASRTGVWESNPPAAVLTATNAAGLLAPLTPAGSLESIVADADSVERRRFDLGDVDLAEIPDEETFRIGLADVVEPPALRGPPALDENPRQAFEHCDPETRIRGLELLPLFRGGASPTLSLWPHQACGFSCREVASDSRYDPWGLSWTTFSYGVAEGAVNMLLGFIQAGMHGGSPLGALDPVQHSVNLTRPGQPTLVTSLRDPVAELKGASVVLPVGEMLGRFAGNAAMTVAGWLDSSAPQDYLDETHADLGRDAPGVALTLSPLPKLLRNGGRAATGAAASAEGEGAGSAGYLVGEARIARFQAHVDRLRSSGFSGERLAELQGRVEMLKEGYIEAGPSKLRGSFSDPGAGAGSQGIDRVFRHVSDSTNLAALESKYRTGFTMGSDPATLLGRTQMGLQMSNAWMEGNIFKMITGPHGLATNSVGWELGTFGYRRYMNVMNGAGESALYGVVLK